MEYSETGDDYTGPNMGLYGGEPVYHDGNFMGRLRSGGYGYTLARVLGMYTCHAARGRVGTPLEIQIFGERYASEVAADVLYHPKGERIRA